MKRFRDRSLVVCRLAISSKGGAETFIVGENLVGRHDVALRAHYQSKLLATRHQRVGASLCRIQSRTTAAQSNASPAHIL